MWQSIFHCAPRLSACATTCTDTIDLTYLASCCLASSVSSPALAANTQLSNVRSISTRSHTAIPSAIKTNHTSMIFDEQHCVKQCGVSSSDDVNVPSGYSNVSQPQNGPTPSGGASSRPAHIGGRTCTRRRCRTPPHNGMQSSLNYPTTDRLRLHKSNLRVQKRTRLACQLNLVPST